jgi:pSer/pThr/pTyr-binding forkhead associated (FHA) protein
MALILEIRDRRRGVPEYRALTQLPLTIGRGMSNDVIIDDPYLDAIHARLTLDEHGALMLEDLGSVNGTRANGTRVAGPVPVQAGTEVRVGRTMLRFHDQDEPMPAALVESPELSLPRPAQWLMTTRGSLTLVAILCGVVALTTWLSSSDRENASTIFAAVMAVVVMIAVWAGIWSVVTRGPDRHYHLFSHVTVVSALALVMLLYGQLNEWLKFFLPDVEGVELVYMGIALVALAALVAGHLTVAGVLTRRGRWWAGGIVSGLLVLVLAIAGLISEDSFSTVPHFPSELKPVTPALVPTETVSQFVTLMQHAKDEADDAAAK